MYRKTSTRFLPASQMNRPQAIRWIVLFFVLMVLCFNLAAAFGPYNPIARVCFNVAALLSLAGGIKMISRAKAAKTEEKPAAAQKKPAIPAVSKARRKAKPAREYQAILNQLQANCESIEESKRLVHQLIDDYFGGSLISSSKYKNVLEDASRVLKKNYENASQAVALFGSSKPTPQRLAILQNYLHDSQDIVDNVSQVVDELLKARQDSTLKDGSALDQSLEELVNTTVYYTRKGN